MIDGPKEVARQAYLEGAAETDAKLRDEVKALTEKLNRQSTQLAEALREKNDSLDRLCIANGQLLGYQKVFNGLDLQTLGRELGLKTGTDVVPNILPKVRQMKEAIADLSMLLSKKTDELNARLIELEKRSPSPKFRVGQIVVVVRTGNAFTIHHSERFCNVWHYSNFRERPGFADWTAETGLRALTPNEMGKSCGHADESQCTQECS